MIPLIINVLIGIIVGIILGCIAIKNEGILWIMLAYLLGIFQAIIMPALLG